MKISLFVVPAAAYPRYNYSRKHVLPLVERYRDLLELLSLKDMYPLPIFGDVSIYVIHDKSSVTICPESLAPKYSDKIECTESPYPPHDKEKQPHGIGIYIATHKQTVEHEDILANTGKHLIFLLDQEARERSSPLIRGKQDNIIYTSTVANVSVTIIDLLERIVFRSLFERVKVLQCFLELENPTVLFATLDSDTKSGFKQQTSAAVKRIVQLQYRKTPQEFTENLIEQLLRDDTDTVTYPESNICEAIIPVFNIGGRLRGKLFGIRSSKTLSGRSLQKDKENIADNYSPEEIRANDNEGKGVHQFTSMSNELTAPFTKHTELVAAHEQITEELYGEMQGMYYRSKVPLSDKPTNTTEINETLDETVARQILEINGVTGVGYRYRILDIFLKDTLTDDEQIESEQSLRELLKREKIIKYLFHAEPEHISNFAEVGSTLKIKRSGTLGGFVRLGKDKDLCVLLAGHIADQGKPVYLQPTPRSDSKSIFAHVLEPNNASQRDGSLDIALAKVLKKCKEDCNVQFKDEEGNCRASEVYRYDDIKWLNGLPVHIWGATSSPGLGKIAIPVLYIKDMEEKLMKIEDRRGCMKSFAREGDSGAVVCANDQDEEKVKILAMVIGESCSRETAGNNKQRKVQYVSFRLINGLQQLKDEQEKDIELC